ncbi:hypothetical protein M0R45_033342 [Rubus argutus]|uniref:Uncharacterized protein n=1 Tax=Rubus argutus TaxID=59490 RepID=A0AAW1WML3_RUBAR
MGSAKKRRPKDCLLLLLNFELNFGARGGIWEELRSSVWALHQYIISLIAMLGLLLQLKQGQAAGSKSPFETDHVLILTFIAVFLIYIGSLATVKTLQSLTSDLAEFINNISVLFGFLAAILLLFILVPAFGWCTLGLWIVYFLRDVVTKKSYSWALLSVLSKVKELFKGQENTNAESVVQIPDTGVLQTTVVQIQDAGHGHGELNVNENTLEKQDGVP